MEWCCFVCAEWYQQVMQWGQQFRQQGVFRVWLVTKPVVGVTTAETAEVSASVFLSLCLFICLFVCLLVSLLVSCQWQNCLKLGHNCVPSLKRSIRFWPFIVLWNRNMTGRNNLCNILLTLTLSLTLLVLLFTAIILIVCCYLQSPCFPLKTSI